MTATCVCRFVYGISPIAGNVADETAAPAGPPSPRHLGLARRALIDPHPPSALLVVGRAEFVESRISPVRGDPAARGPENLFRTQAGTAAFTRQGCGRATTRNRGSADDNRLPQFDHRSMTIFLATIAIAAAAIVILAKKRRR
jgi:hypothetical protein